jgi:hypothetical protein
MFTTYANTAIDAVQTSKKIAVDTFVKHEDLAKTLNKFVDAQTEYTKKAVDASFTAGTKMVSLFSTKAFYEESLTAIQDSMKTWLPKTK